LMAIGRGDGEHRAVQAAHSALNSPLLDSRLISSAATILVNITGGPDLTLHEVSEAAQLISEAAHPEADILFGAVIDPDMGRETRVTLVAGGIDTREPGVAPSREAARPSGRRFAQAQQATARGGSTNPEGWESERPADGDRGGDARSTGPIPAYWTVPVRSQQAAGQAAGASFGGTHAGKEHSHPSYAASSASDPLARGAQPAVDLSVHAVSSSHMTAGQSPTPLDPEVAQGVVPADASERDEEELQAETRRNGHRQRTTLRFLPRLDLPTFLRR
jgi:cell division protein FtsZ